MPEFKGVLNAFKKAFKHLYTKGSYQPEDIKTIPYQNLTNEIYKVLDLAIKENDIPPVMLSKLKKDIFIFSGLKTHAELLEASKMLLDVNGHIKSFHAFAKDIEKIMDNYNNNYLYAEYQFAITSSQMAAKWAELDDTERYNLQYRTAGDNKVRKEHKELNKITLPKSDPFWVEYYPPNAWNCRCVAVEVLVDKYSVSDSEKALNLGKKATTQINKDGKNKLKLFRFNPGIQFKVFPPNHPYTKVEGANEVKKILEENIKYIPDSLNEYEKTLNITIDKTIFNKLNRETPLYFKNPKEHANAGSGAYYSPSYNFVKIPIDERRKKSKWYSTAVIYHEYGHAIDNHHDLTSNILIRNLMDKYITSFSKNKNQEFKTIDQRLKNFLHYYLRRKNYDMLEKIGACLDTLMALNSNFGAGHTKEYFVLEGKKEAEFIAHIFENKYAGNEVFKKVMPELYEETINILDKIFKLK
ncbi:phage putative head morphogenesis protein, SPP1 gp7 family [Apibacter mensalis]|uniref:Phage putative head morphogenesis protein, SPP1 gp7 family n=1 Tax=Apibacter mensalis TaxID=1586267 RepID=A0A0X3ARN4_9FLAO|nr:phage minor head protein [Apibacter mensalis]CVK17110.1 phage putative head morphogenesis protein, SPP1 gp7 family [Apibacter mensalis]